jgi:hypothetical protein
MIPGLNKRVLNFYDIMLYAALLRKHLRLMVLLVCMCLLAGVAAYVYSRPVYFARSHIRMNNLPLPMDSDSVFHDSSWGAVIGELKSPAIMERTAHRLGVDADAREIAENHIKLLRIAPSADWTGLEVEVYSYDPSWPTRWTEIMVDEFMKSREEGRIRTNS